jgi:hypothetical protein
VRLAPARLPRQAGEPEEKDFREWEYNRLPSQSEIVCVGVGVRVGVKERAKRYNAGEKESAVRLCINFVVYGL